ncbi:hypothetical protein T484DRAFT_1844145 [Baffinella frigidus]|nr:hypothetical protein T484DRAFT_1844145 [Cryptophyta sp. CCMP2293]
MRTSRSPRSPRRFLSQRVLALAAVAVLGFSAAQEQGGQRQCRAYPLVQGVSLRDGKSSTAGSKNTTKLVMVSLG